MTKPIIILGTGGNCIDIVDLTDEVNRAAGAEVYRCVGFLDDDPARHGKEVFGLKVLGPLESAYEHAECSFVNGIGSPRNFRRKPEIIASANVPLDRFATLVHPSASVSRRSLLGHGVVILQNATVASNVRIGDHVIVLPNSIISHDAEIGDYTCVAGGVCVSGNVSVGGCCYLGTNSSIRGGVKVGNGALVGMGSVVLDDIEANGIVVGNPARGLSKKRS